MALPVFVCPVPHRMAKVMQYFPHLRPSVRPSIDRSIVYLWPETWPNLATKDRFLLVLQDQKITQVSTP